MNQTSLRRRLVAAAAALLVGAAGGLAFGSPALAQTTPSASPAASEPASSPADPAPPEVTFDDACKGTTVTLTGAEGTAWLVTAGGEEVAVEASSFTLPADAGPIVVTFAGAPAEGWPQTHTWAEPAGGCDLDADIRIVTTCDELVFLLRNNGEEGGVWLVFTLFVDAMVAPAPDFLPMLDQEEDGEVPPGARLRGTELQTAGEPFELMANEVGQARAIGMEAFEDLAVIVLTAVNPRSPDREVVNEQRVEWDPAGLDCEEGSEGDEGGEGGGLPTTGTPATLIAGGAVGLLVLGVGAFLLTHRRRITFTA